MKKDEDEGGRDGKQQGGSTHFDEEDMSWKTAMR